MKCYRIRNWLEHYETHETKKMKCLAWLPTPNKHDGRGFKRLMRLPNGPALYGTWILLAQVASKMPVRGVLRDEDGPLDADDLSIKTEAPAELFTEALEVLSNPKYKIEWLEIVAESPDVPGRAPDMPGESPGVLPDAGRNLHGLSQPPTCTPHVTEKPENLPAHRDAPPAHRENLPASGNERIERKKERKKEERERGAREEQPPSPVPPAAPLSLGSQEGKSTTTATTTDEQPVLQDPLAERLRLKINWGTTNLQKLAETAERLRHEFPNSEALILVWVESDDCKPGTKPWDCYGKFRKWVFEKRKREKTLEQQAKLTRLPDAPDREPTEEDKRKYIETMRKLGTQPAEGSRMAQYMADLGMTSAQREEVSA